MADQRPGAGKTYMMAVLADMILHTAASDTRIVILAPQNRIVQDIFNKLLILHGPESRQYIIHPRMTIDPDGWPVNCVDQHFKEFSEVRMRSRFDILTIVDEMVGFLSRVAEEHPNEWYLSALKGLLCFRHQYLFMVIYPEQFSMKRQLQEEVRIVVCTSATWRKMLSGGCSLKYIYI